VQEVFERGGEVSQYGDGESVDVCDNTEPTARKRHTCHACGEAITPGRKYARVAFLYDGSWHVTKRCERCQVIFEHLSKRIRAAGDSEEYCDPSLNCGHEYEERWRDPPPDHIAALAFWRPGDPLPTEDGGAK
jgi:RNase P subunit RPR2